MRGKLSVRTNPCESAFQQANWYKRESFDLIRPPAEGTFPCQGKAFGRAQHRRFSPKASPWGEASAAHKPL